MIVIKIFMWPGGDENREVEIGRGYLTNQVKTTNATAGRLGDYDAQFRSGVYGRPELLKRIWKTSTVSGFNRKTRSAWDLLYLALKDAIGYRNA